MKRSSKLPVRCSRISIPGLCRSLIWRSGFIFLLLVSFGIAGTELSGQENDELTRAIREFDYERAIYLADSLESAGMSTSFHEIKALAYKGLNRFRDAAEQYKYLYMLDTLDLHVLIELAGCYSAMGDFGNARDYYGRALMLRPASPFLVQKMGDTWFQDDQYTKALASYLEAVRTDSSYYLLKQTARCYDNLTEYDTAIIWYRKALAATRIDLQSSYRLAMLYRDREAYDSALNVTRSYLEKDSANLRMLRATGYLSYLNGEYQEAIYSLEKCLSFNDISDFTHRYLGYSLFKTGNYDSARVYLIKAFTVDSTNAELCYVLGLACDYSYYRVEGISYLEQSIRLQTPAPELLSRIYQDLASAHTGLYKYDEALDDYRKAYSSTPEDTILLFRLAYHFDNWIADRDSAVYYYRMFLEREPEGRRSPKRVLFNNEFVSYYEYARRRLDAIKEERFWEGETGE